MSASATAKPPVPHNRLTQAIATTRQGLDYARERMPKSLQRSLDGFARVSDWIQNNAGVYNGAAAAAAPATAKHAQKKRKTVAQAKKLKTRTATG